MASLPYRQMALSFLLPQILPRPPPALWATPLMTQDRLSRFSPAGPMDSTDTPLPCLAPSVAAVSVVVLPQMYLASSIVTSPLWTLM